MTTDPIREMLDNRPGRDFTDLRAVLVNCSLNKSAERIDTAGRVDIKISEMGPRRVAVETIRAIDGEVATSGGSDPAADATAYIERLDMGTTS